MAERRDQRRIVGIAINALRTSIGWSQRELGDRSGVSQSMVCRIERGQVHDLTFGTAESLLWAMGARLVVQVDSPFLGDRERQRDPVHARLSAYVVRRLRAHGWEVRVEVEVGGDRSRGWIDVLAFHSTTGVLLVIELKTEIHDLGQIERSLGWYEREAWAAARRFGWRPSRLVGCLLLLMTEANDRRAAANRGSIDLGFPVRARDLIRSVRGDAEPMVEGRAIAMVDPRSKRRDWCRAMRIDGRRSRAPFLDYADFMRVVGIGDKPR
jgi:transcriptional regulator with XRE-family HTH domain